MKKEEIKNLSLIFDSEKTILAVAEKNLRVRGRGAVEELLTTLDDNIRDGFKIDSPHDVSVQAGLKSQQVARGFLQALLDALREDEIYFYLRARTRDLEAWVSLLAKELEREEKKGGI